MNIYFSGIGGVAIGPLSLIALDAGYEVQGSDAQAGRVTEQLEKRGIPVFIGQQDGHFLQVCHTRKPIDLLVHTSALPPDHPELALARKLGIKTVKRDELIAKIIDEKQLKLLAVAGTHGKTTTTGMLIWALKQLGIPVSYSIGTTISFGPSGLFDPGSQYFVYECDEFDRNFLHFSPYLSLITSVDYDHPDTYPSEDDYLTAFRQFIEQSHMTIMWQRDNERVKAAANDNWLLRDDEVVAIGIPGVHNRRNGTLVIKALEYLKIADEYRSQALLRSFPGTDRRFEHLADNLYTDYGHHPVEIAATLQMARELSNHVVVIYQPHQNVRQHEIKDDYKNAFQEAEKIYWLPTYLSREDSALPVLTPENLIANLSNRHAAQAAKLDDYLWDEITKARQAGKLVLAMGAGSLDGWLRQKLGS
jgi:UDP-N-acetylmuramate--alanine ligase